MQDILVKLDTCLERTTDEKTIVILAVAVLVVIVW